MLVEVSAVADDSWDVAADRTEGYADQIAMQEGLWLEVAPPNGLQEAHQAQAQALETEAEMMNLLATQLRSRTWNVVKGTKDVRPAERGDAAASRELSHRARVRGGRARCADPVEVAVTRRLVACSPESRGAGAQRKGAAATGSRPFSQSQRRSAECVPGSGALDLRPGVGVGAGEGAEVVVEL